MKWFFTHIVKIYFLAVAVLALFLWNGLFPGDDAPVYGEEAHAEADSHADATVETPLTSAMDRAITEPQAIPVETGAGDDDNAPAVAGAPRHEGALEQAGQGPEKAVNTVEDAQPLAADPELSDSMEPLPLVVGKDQAEEGQPYPAPMDADADSAIPEQTGPASPAESVSVRPSAPQAGPVAGPGVNQRFLRARAAFWNRRPDQAVREYAAILAREPGNWAALEEVGNVHLMMGDRDLAMRAHRRAARLLWRSGKRFRAWKQVNAIAEYAPEQAAALAGEFRQDAMNIRHE